MKHAKIIEFRSEPPRSWGEALERFLLWKRADGASERSLKGYKDVVLLFFKRFPLAWGGSCRECVMRFLAQEDIAPTTYNMRIKGLRPFFEFCVKEEAFAESPARDFSTRKAEPRVVDHSPADLVRLVGVIGTRTFSRLRDTALIFFQLDTGIRPNEALLLRPGDIDPASRKAIVRPAISKTRTARLVFFSEKTAALLEKLILVRPEEWGENVPVFCTAYGAPWNTHAWSVNLRRYAERAGLKRFSAYDLRHVHAIQYLRNGGDVFTLQKIMGHSDLSMTEKYLAFSDEDLRIAHEKASPVDHLFSKKRPDGQREKRARIGRV